jgi:transposase-like protein
VRSASDEALALAAAGGDGLAFEELARRYRPLIFAAWRWLPDGLEAEDARQAALIGLWEACRGTDGVRRFAGMAKRRVRWHVAAARRDAMARKRRILTDALYASDGDEEWLASVAAPEGNDPARIVELREVARERMRELAAIERRRASAPGGDLRRRYSREQRDAARATLAEDGSIHAAAAAAGVGYFTAHRWITRAPADSPAGREVVARRSASPSGTLGRSFRDDEKARALALVAQGGSITSAAGDSWTWPLPTPAGAHRRRRAGC